MKPEQLPIAHTTHAVGVATAARTIVELEGVLSSVLAAMRFAHPDASLIGIERDIAYAAIRWADRKLGELQKRRAAEWACHAPEPEKPGSDELSAPGDVPGDEWAGDLAVGTPIPGTPAVNGTKGRRGKR